MTWWAWCIGPALLALLLAYAVWDGKREDKRERFILKHLTDYNDAYGLELVKYSGGLLKRGTVYITLDRMEQAGLIESHEELTPPRHIGIPRKLYRLTDEGRREVREIARAA